MFCRSVHMFYPILFIILLCCAENNMFDRTTLTDPTPFAKVPTKEIGTATTPIARIDRGASAMPQQQHMENTQSTANAHIEKMFTERSEVLNV